MKHFIRRFVLMLSAVAAFSALSVHAQNIEVLDPNRILVVAGEPREMGLAHGQAMSQTIHLLIDGWLMPKLRSVPVLGEYYARWKAQTMAAHLPADLKAEMEAVAEAAGVEFPYLMIGNAFPDIAELMRRPIGCSTFVVLPFRSLTGGMWSSRNLDYGDSDILRPYWQPTLFAAKGKLKVLSINIPGMSGVLTAINERGVMMSRMTSYSKDMTAHGMPSMILFRQVLEQATTAEEAKSLYLAARRTVAINIMITDAREALVLEVTADPQAVRRPSDDGLLYAANHFEVAEMKDPEHGRDERWRVLTRFDGRGGQLGFDDVVKVIGDAGREQGNVLAAMVDYGSGRLIFGSDPEGRGTSAFGKLYAIDLRTVFGMAR